MKRLPAIINATAGCYRLTNSFNGKVWDAGTETFVAPATITALADLFTDLEAETINSGATNTGLLKLEIPDSVPVGDYELVVYNMAGASVTAAKSPYIQAKIEVDSSGFVFIKE